MALTLYILGSFSALLALFLIRTAWRSLALSIAIRCDEAVFPNPSDQPPPT